ncbi:MAG: NADH-quinone oxidoreductase subunit J [Acidimicrobiales bacterium]|nr:NADH-quinone oxidoreductase subunit J [Acidimicrobiales bacterium]
MTTLLAADLNVAQNIAFGIIALVIVASALRVVTTNNVVHAALYLVLVLAGVAGLYFILGAEFVGTTQILVYIGAVIVLFLFGIMLTRAPIGGEADLDHDQRWVGGLVAVLLLAVIGYTLIDRFEDTELPADTVTTTAQVSDAIFGTYLVPFEVVSVLLLAALVGAIVVARRD